MKHSIQTLSTLLLMILTLGTANGQNWLITGNSGITANNFLGPRNKADLILRANASSNGFEVARFTPNNAGWVGKANEIDPLCQSGFAAGESNYLSATASSSVVAGYANACESEHGYAFGAYNSVTGPNAACVGINTEAIGDHSFAFGAGLSAGSPLSNNIPYSVMVGIGNNPGLFITETLMGIHTTNPDPFSTLDVNGDIYSYGVWIGSDRNFKKDIRTLDGALGKIMAMRGTEYLFRKGDIAGKNFPAEEQYGFIAQELKEVSPNLVRTGADGYMRVNYTGVIPVLVEAMKEQQTQIEEKETAIVSLQKQMEKLEARLAALENGLAAASDTRGAVQTVASEATFNVSPNPTRGQFQVTLSQAVASDNVAMLVFDGNGREVARQTIEKGNTSATFNLSLPAGMYTVSMLSNGRMGVGKALAIGK